MKRIDIDRIFGLLVKQYLDDGYVVNTDSMNGNQGEVAKVDLRNGDDLIRVVLSRGFDAGLTGTPDTLVLVVGRYTKPIHPGWTIWTGDFTDVERHVFWQLGRDWYAGNEDYVKDCFKKKKARWHNYYSNIDRLKVGLVFLPDSARKVVLNRVRNLPRCKSVKLSDIGNVWRERKDGAMTYFASVRDETRKIGEVKIA